MEGIGGGANSVGTGGACVTGTSAAARVECGGLKGGIRIVEIKAVKSKRWQAVSRQKLLVNPTQLQANSENAYTYVGQKTLGVCCVLFIQQLTLSRSA